MRQHRGKSTSLSFAPQGRTRAHAASSSPRGRGRRTLFACRSRGPAHNDLPLEDTCPGFATPESPRRRSRSRFRSRAIHRPCRAFGVRSRDPAADPSGLAERSGRPPAYFPGSNSRFISFERERKCAPLQGSSATAIHRLRRPRGMRARSHVSRAVPGSNSGIAPGTGPPRVAARAQLDSIRGWSTGPRTRACRVVGSKMSSESCGMT